MKRFLFFLLSMLFLTGTSYSQSLYFNGTSNYVKLANDSDLCLTSFTLEAWIKMDGLGRAAVSGVGGLKAVPVVTKGRGEADRPSGLNLNYFLGVDSNHRVCADFEEASGPNHPVVSNGSISDNVWTHIAVSYEPTSAVWKLYINGVLDVVKDLGSNKFPASSSIQPAAIGTALNSKGVAAGFFKGRIDEVRIWRGIRTREEIAASYRLAFSSGAGLVARYGFNEGAGSKALNAVRSLGAGALINAPVWTNDFNNAPPNPPVNASTVSTNATNDSTAKLCVTVSDKNNDRLRVRFYGRKKVTSTKFTIVLLPDTQFYTSELNGGNNNMFKSQTRWIARNRANKNIVYVGQLGDCSQHGDRYEVEWKRADTAMKLIEDPASTGLPQGVPYGICVGNHDQSPMYDPGGTTTFYNDYFGSARFSGRSYYGGHNGNNNDNHYQLFSASGIDFLVICFEYDQGTGFTAAGGALDWGEALIRKYPNRKVIVLTHYTINEDSSFSAQGRAIYNRYKVYPNFMLLAGGHMHKTTGEAKRTDTFNGNVVHTTLQDYQSGINGGNGLMRIYEFDPLNNMMAVKTYSPYTNTYQTDSLSQFTLKVPLTPNATPFTYLGEVSQLSPGTTACISWPALDRNTTYEWYANVFDGERTVTGPVWAFTTANTSTLGNLHVDRTTVLPLIKEAMHFDNESLVIYPNPNKINRLTMAFAKELIGRVQINIFDEAGNLQLQRIFMNVSGTINLEHHLAPGAYTVVTTAVNYRSVKKLIVL